MAFISNGTTVASGGSLQNVPAPSSANVGTATAGLSAGAVGTYVAGRYNSGTTYSGGSTISGSSLKYANFGPSGDSGSLSGTWRAMGRAGPFGYNDNTATVWLRIS